MNLDNLSQKLVRELRRSPQKSAILAIMCLVAMYYWVPLFRGWLGGSGASEDPPQLTMIVPAAATGSVPDSEIPEQFRKKTPWHKLTSWIDVDPRMQPAELATTVAPFRTQDELVDVDAQAAASVDTGKITPASMGLVLQSTVLSRGGGMALINDQSFPLGSQVRLQRAGIGEVAFRLQEIHPDRVILQRAGEQFVLRLPARQLKNGDWIRTTKPR